MNFYRNGNYIVCMMNDGTKIRKTNDSEFKPSFSECCDITITYKCKVGCKYCYAGCTNNGKHGDLFKYKFLDTLHPYTEIAFNGNDMDHPQLIPFLNKLKEKKVFANMTVNQQQFMENYDLIKNLTDNKLIYGIGISYASYDENFINKVKEFPNAVIHVINGVIKLSDLKKIKDNDLKILILGYKNIRRGETFIKDNPSKIRTNKRYIYEELPKIINEKWFKAVSFDNLAIEQVDAKRLMTEEQWEEFYMGNDGEFTFFIDMVNGKFSKNSCTIKNYEIGDKTIDEMFNLIKNSNNE